MSTPPETTAPAKVEDVSKPTMTEQFDSLIDRLSEQITSMKTLLVEVKAIKKEATKPVKFKKVKKERDPNKPPPFTKPVEISPELRKFLKQEGDISRTEVTQKMYAYIKDKKLQNPEMKRQFIIDKPLAKLFKVDEKTSMEYFKLQTHMKQHYPKTEVKA